MWTVLKALALRMAVGRTLGGMLATLFLFLVPIAGVLKVIGLPILIVLGVVGAPIFLLLAAIGLPVLVVVGFGGVLLRSWADCSRWASWRSRSPCRSS